MIIPQVAHHYQWAPTKAGLNRVRDAGCTDGRRNRDRTVFLNSLLTLRASGFHTRRGWAAVQNGTTDRAQADNRLKGEYAAGAQVERCARFSGCWAFVVYCAAHSVDCHGG